MKGRFQFGAWLGALALSAITLVPCAFGQSKDRPAPRPQQSRGADHASRDNVGRQSRPSGGGYHPQNAPRRNENQSRQPNSNDRAYRGNRPQNQTRQSPAAPTPTVQERLRSKSPQEQQALAQRDQQFHQLPPQKQQEMKRAAANWDRMTPEQRDHIKNDVLPVWRQMSPDRQKAVSSRLHVLQNMPESARNRHLSDPNFTRGMSEEDKQMLRDLSHQHVGAPDPAQP